MTELKADGKLLEAQRLEMRVNYDLEMLETMGFTSGIENYSRHLDGRQPGEPANTLIDYFGDDFLTIIDESHVTVPQIRGMHEGDKSRKITLVEHGFRLPSALDNRPLRFDEFEAKRAQWSCTSRRRRATTSCASASRSSSRSFARPAWWIREIVVRPVKGQIDDLIGEIKERTESGERTLVTTLTKKMAEDLTDYLFEQGIKVRYLHSDIATLERVDILRELRMGTFDVLVGINLLREGLDLPEVSLVAILDADKEGFLRNGRSLIQTIGRAARNVSGEVIMYADKTTDSMKFAIDETNRRRAKQVAYNTEHGIEPQTIRKAIADIVQYMHEGDAQTTTAVEAARELSKLPHAEVMRLISTMEEDMAAAAAALDFETAARLRDQAVKLRAEVESTSTDEVLGRLKAGARKGSAYGRRKRR